jgi:VanZ family protein
MGLDKVAHLCMYAVFAFLCLWGYRKQFISNGIHYKRKAVLLAVVISIAYGGLTELMQEYIVRTRTGDWVDFVADIIGTLLGATIFYLFYKKKK